MMQSILILGGTGRTGIHIVKEAIDKGFWVTVMSRNPEQANFDEHPRLELVKGDVLNYVDVFNAAQGIDIIISALGKDGRKTEIFTCGTSNILKAITKSRVKRFICLSSLGAGSTRNLAGWQLRFLIWMAGLRKSFEAKANQELLLFQSNINFTLVMAGTLVNDSRFYRWYAGLPDQIPLQGPMPAKIDRREVAAFLLSQTFDNSWVRKTVCLVGGPE
jgi:nucleoside-diphosphate-sugar epimerase